MTTVSLKNVGKKLHGSQVLDAISLEAGPGRVVGLCGINGSGKTMLLRVIAGLVRPSNGQVMIDDKPLWEEIAFPPSVGILIENPAFLELKTGFDNLKLLASIKGKIADSDIRSAIEDMGLDPYDTRKFRKYSLGMKQRLGLAAAFMAKPGLLLLDEPTNALDEDGCMLFSESLMACRASGSLAFVASHDAGLINEIADEIIRMKDGKIVSRELVRS